MSQACLLMLLGLRIGPNPVLLAPENFLAPVSRPSLHECKHEDYRLLAIIDQPHLRTLTRCRLAQCSATYLLPRCDISEGFVAYHSCSYNSGNGIIASLFANISNLLLIFTMSALLASFHSNLAYCKRGPWPLLFITSWNWRTGHQHEFIRAGPIYWRAIH